MTMTTRRSRKGFILSFVPISDDKTVVRIAVAGHREIQVIYEGDAICSIMWPDQTAIEYAQFYRIIQDWAAEQDMRNAAILRGFLE